MATHLRLAFLVEQTAEVHKRRTTVFLGKRWHLQPNQSIRKSEMDCLVKARNRTVDYPMLASEYAQGMRHEQRKGWYKVPLPLRKLMFLWY